MLAASCPQAQNLGKQRIWGRVEGGETLGSSVKKGRRVLSSGEWSHRPTLLGLDLLICTVMLTDLALPSEML